jgi:hypothetical protein
MHPSRKQNRRRGFSGLAREPIAFRYVAENRVFLAENPNAEAHAAVLNYSRRTLAHESAMDRLTESTEPVRVSFPGRDTLGRRNPRMARRQLP